MNLRLLPIVLFALSALLALKGLDVLARRGIEFSGVTTAAHAAGPPPAPAQPPGSQERPREQHSVGEPPPSAERLLNERLAERRRQLDDRARQIEEREQLLRAAERRLEERVEELRRLEQSVQAGVQARQDETNQRMRAVVTMYEAMNAREAARIFNRLEMDVLIEIVNRMNPRRTSEIMAQMTPEVAQRLTSELARRATVAGAQPPAGQAPPPAQTPPATRELQRIDPRRPPG